MAPCAFGRFGRLVLIALVAAATLVGAPEASSSKAMTVRLDGRTVVLRAPQAVGAVLARSHLQPRDGVLRAAGSGRVLDAHSAPGLIWINGRPVSPLRQVHAGDHIGALDGRDAVESVSLRPARLVAPSGPLPDVERDLWTSGADGLAEQVVGATSGEVVAQYVIRAPVPAGPMPGRVVALTFDDGPDPRYTPQILEVLRQAGVHATFCVVGYEARARPDLIERIHDDGDALCDHTEHHPRLDLISPAAAEAEIEGPAAFVAQVTGERPRFLRAPYGATNPTVIDLAHRHGLRVLGWSVDPSDFTRPAPSVIAARVLSAVHPGAIVGMHDGGGDRTNTIAALPAIITGLEARGYTLVTPGP
jgi:peptidoglycan/xylan/chitin deacetylase (PgdA/CDA1 family)